jgi:hypothetical protein
MSQPSRFNRVSGATFVPQSDILPCQFTTVYLRDTGPKGCRFSLSRPTTPTSGHYAFLALTQIPAGSVLSVADYHPVHHFERLPIKVGTLTDSSNRHVGYVFYSHLSMSNSLGCLTVYSSTFANDPSNAFQDVSLVPVARTKDFSAYHLIPSCTFVFCGYLDQDLDDNTRL